MRIGEPYLRRNFPFKIDVSGGKFEEGKTVDKSGHTSRLSRIKWINDASTLAKVLNYAKIINKDAGWNFEIDGVEPLQYTEYGEGG